MDLLDDYVSDVDDSDLEPFEEIPAEERVLGLQNPLISPVQSSFPVHPLTDVVLSDVEYIASLIDVSEDEEQRRSSPEEETPPRADVFTAVKEDIVEESDDDDDDEESQVLEGHVDLGVEENDEDDEAAVGIEPMRTKNECVEAVEGEDVIGGWLEASHRGSLQVIGAVLYSIEHEKTVVVQGLSSDSLQPVKEGSVLYKKDGLILGELCHCKGC